MASFAAMRPAGPDFPSRGHFVDGRRATVLVNALAAAPYAARHPEERFPVGAVLVERLAGERTRTAPEASVLFVMTKRAPGSFAAGHDWDYTVAQLDGTVEASGPLPVCARCHAEAPSDGVFGLP